MITGLCKRYGTVRALVDVELRARRGSVIGLVGPNGSGKSTLLRVVAGLVRPDAGVVEVGGRRAGTLDAARAAAFVPDEPDGLDEITVRELLTLIARLHRVDAEPARMHLVDAFVLAPLLARRLGELSRGQRRRAAIVAAFQLDAPLVLVDEATAALDSASVGALRTALARASATGSAVVLATHDRAFVEGVADEIVVLSAGRVVEERPTGGRAIERSCEPAAA